VLYTLYNLAATLASVPAGRAGDRRGHSALAGLLWTLASPAVAFGYAAVLMAIALLLLAYNRNAA
jgi:MFS family permease